MAQQELAQSREQTSIPIVEQSVKHAVQLHKELQELSTKLSTNPELKKQLEQQSTNLNELIKQGKLEASQADKLLAEIRLTLEQVKKSNISSNVQGLVEQASTNPIFTKEIVIPIAELGIKKEDVIFKYTQYDKAGLRTWGDFHLSSDGIKTWSDNLMQVSVADTNGKLVLSVYRGFEGEIDFDLKGHAHKVSQRSGVFKSDFLLAPDTEKASLALDSLARSLNPMPTNPAPPVVTPQLTAPALVSPKVEIFEFKSEVKDVKIQGIQAGTSLYDALIAARKEGLEVVLTKYSGSDGFNVFEIREGHQTVGLPILIRGNSSQAGRDYFAERNSKIEASLNSLMQDRTQGLQDGVTQLYERVSKLNELVSGQEVKKALAELEYSNQHNSNGPNLRQQWQAVLSSRELRDLLSLDDVRPERLTTDLIAKANKRIDAYENNLSVLTTWAKTNGSENLASYSGFDINFAAIKKEPANVEIAPPELKPRELDINRQKIESPSLSIPETPIEIAPDLSQPSLVPRAATPDIELATPAEDGPVRARPAPAEPILDPVVETPALGATPSIPELRPSRRSEITRPVHIEPELMITPNFDIPEFQPEITLSNPSLQRSTTEDLIPELVLPPIESIRREPAPFQPIEETVEMEKIPATEFDQLKQKARESKLPVRIDAEQIKSLGIDAKIVDAELLYASEKELVVRGMNPDTLRPVYYRGSQEEGLKLSSQRYDLLTSSWIDIEVERPVTRSPNFNANIMNNSIATSILSVDPNVSSSAAHMTEYFESTHRSQGHFIGTVTDLKSLFFNSQRGDLKFIPSMNLVDQHFRDAIAEIKESKTGLTRIPSSSVPEEYNKVGDICICYRKQAGKPEEIMMFRSKLDETFMKNFVVDLEQQGWSVSAAERARLLEGANKF